MNKRLSDIYCVFLIHFARLRAEAGPFFLASLIFPIGMYLFAVGVANRHLIEAPSEIDKTSFLSASIVFSLSLTAISWLGYLLLENRFMGRLKLFATLPIAASSYIVGVLVFAIAQGVLGTTSMLIAAWFLGVGITFGAGSLLLLSLIVVISILSLCGLSVVIAARARSFSEGSLLTDALGGGLVLLAPIFYPVESLPRVLQQLAGVLPTTYIFRAVNKTLSGETAVANEILVLIASASVTLTAGFWLMKWRDN